MMIGSRWLVGASPFCSEGATRRGRAIPAIFCLIEPPMRAPAPCTAHPGPGARSVRARAHGPSRWELNSRALEFNSPRSELNSRLLEFNSQRLELNSQPREFNSRGLKLNSHALEFNSRRLELNFHALELNFHALEFNFTRLAPSSGA